MKRDYFDIEKNCIITLPYPKVTIKEKNIEYANLLKKCYSGLYSELTLLNQYNYQQLFLEETLKNIFKKIATVEMNHLNIIGELIISLGGNPSTNTKRKNKTYYWTSKVIKKYTNLKEILEYNIKSEEEIIKEYRKLAIKINNENIITIINRIILDEELHIKIFKTIYKNELY
ncbi:MAG: manganese catalase family protein [Clostridium sp.]|nr:manganese catalase family protein [Clostridium sp.]